MKHGATIMLVDDDHDFLVMNRSILEARGYRVLTASSSREALETAKRVHPDLVVTDLMMADLDAGFSLSRAIKEDPATSATPILIVTAASSQRGFDLRPRGPGELAAMRADAFLDKPVSPSALLAKVEELLR
jgi:CheY-like chemotaxis protein